MTNEEMMAQMMSMMKTMQSMQSELIALKSAKVEPVKAVAKAEPKEVVKAWADRSLAEKYESEMARAESFQKSNKIDDKSFKMFDASKGIAFMCRLQSSWKDAKGEEKSSDNIIIKLLDYHKDYATLAGKLVALGFKYTYRKFNKCWVYSAKFDATLFKSALSVVKEQMKGETTEEVKPIEKEEPKAEEVVDEVEEEPIAEEVEETTEEVEEEPTTTVKSEDNAELISAKEALAKARAELEELNKKLEEKRNSVSNVLNEYKYTTLEKK